ncbi:FAD-dependent monooxygenase [Rhodoferax sp.]|uniref:FAD-dependent monooxygenase n=1 Tax=Rhodoferax sp. TaxID=50421 RepID=UPI00284B9BBE|nr:FAD-dependent monooxygenase [Rhodoferax sp.]MDR3369387.1 FAD-dependent monooxygenase [Rhodoferax sp.]
MVDVVIAGGGIGGLSAALACAREGGNVRLYERTTEFSEVGAGIQLGPNVVRVLHSWDMQEALAGIVAFPDRVQFRSAVSGTVLGELPLGADMVRRYGAPYVTIHRGDLHGLLVQTLGQYANVALQLSNAVVGLAQTEASVTAHLADTQQVQGDVLVAADGAWSVLRQQILNDGKPQPTGHLAYRAMVRQSNLPKGLRSQQVTAWFGPRLHVVQYPVRGGDWLNVVGIVHGHVQGDMSNWDQSANAADLQRVMAGTCAPLHDLIHAIESWRLWPLSIRQPMRGAHEHALGRVALLGDAAHPMVPYLAQGAAMAMEDAATLAQVLAAGGVFSEGVSAAAACGQIPALLKDYANQRWQRNARVQQRAIKNGEIYHLTGPMRLGRDLAMRALGTRLLDQPWLYGGGPIKVT